MEDCDRQNCKNYGKLACNRCFNHSLYRQKPTTRLSKSKKSKKEGMEFQRRVQRQHDEKLGSSRQCLNSGALWFDPGDIITERDLIECKERRITARGEKNFTITQEILNKIEAEAGPSRSGIVVFGFKGDDKTYCVAKYDLWLTLVQENLLLRKLIEEKNNGV